MARRETLDLSRVPCQLIMHIIFEQLLINPYSTQWKQTFYIEKGIQGHRPDRHAVGYGGDEEYNTDWESIEPSDLCYSGSFLIDAAAGWKTIVLDTPFAYNGVDNLLVCFDNNTGSWTSTRNWYSYNTGDNRALRIRVAALC